MSCLKSTILGVDFGWLQVRFDAILAISLGACFKRGRGVQWKMEGGSSLWPPPSPLLSTITIILKHHHYSQPSPYYHCKILVVFLVLFYLYSYYYQPSPRQITIVTTITSIIMAQPTSAQTRGFGKRTEQPAMPNQFRFVSYSHVPSWSSESLWLLNHDIFFPQS